MFYKEHGAGPFLYLTKTRAITCFRFGRTSYQILAFLLAFLLAQSVLEQMPEVQQLA